MLFLTLCFALAALSLGREHYFNPWKDNATNYGQGFYTVNGTVFSIRPGKAPKAIGTNCTWRGFNFSHGEQVCTPHLGIRMTCFGKKWYTTRQNATNSTWFLSQNVSYYRGGPPPNRTDYGAFIWQIPPRRPGGPRPNCTCNLRLGHRSNFTNEEQWSRLGNVTVWPMGFDALVLPQAGRYGRSWCIDGESGGPFLHNEECVNATSRDYWHSGEKDREATRRCWFGEMFPIKNATKGKN